MSFEGKGQNLGTERPGIWIVLPANMWPGHQQSVEQTVSLGSRDPKSFISKLWIVDVGAAQEKKAVEGSAHCLALVPTPTTPGNQKAVL